VSDVYATHAERLPSVSYAAYGHIHRPQRLPGRVSGRYAGSLVQLDFGELDEQKEVVIVEAEPGRPAQVETRAVSARRPLRRLEGSLSDIEALASTVGRALCTVVVRTQTPTPDLSQRLADLLPEATLLSVQEDCEATRVHVLTQADVGDDREPTFKELFRDYLSSNGIRAGSSCSTAVRRPSKYSSTRSLEPAQLPDLDQLELPSAAGR
jgi:exonuclease SbcD